LPAIAKHVDPLEEHNKFLEDTLTQKSKHMEEIVGSLEAKIAELEEAQIKRFNNWTKQEFRLLDAEEQIATLREALEKYADEDNWEYVTDEAVYGEYAFELEGGQWAIAKKALQAVKEESKEPDYSEIEDQRRAVEQELKPYVKVVPRQVIV